MRVVNVGVDKSGRVYVVWTDCRDESFCNAGNNDLLLSTSTNGSTWTVAKRIPASPVNGGQDDLLPGLGVDRNSSGGSANLAIVYYYFPSISCTPSTCQLDVGFIASHNGGTSWSNAPGWSAVATWGSSVRRVACSVAELVGANPGEIALMESATRGLDAVLYSLPLEPGDRIHASTHEYASSFIALLQLSRRTGAVVEVMASDADGVPDLEALQASLDDHQRTGPFKKPSECTTSIAPVSPSSPSDCCRRGAEADRRCFSVYACESFRRQSRGGRQGRLARWSGAT
jgi:hypothetical protein